MNVEGFVGGLAGGLPNVRFIKLRGRFPPRSSMCMFASAWCVVPAVLDMSVYGGPVPAI